MRRFLPILIIVLAAVTFSSAEVKAAPRADLMLSPREIIALINTYRAENGLPAYSQNSILMQTAQGQADYQASIESVTHEGPGGTRPRDRAYAAGYGDGQIIFISEIIYGATSAGPETAVSWWKTSQIHNDTMLATQYVHIGAGVAESSGRFYYVAVTGVPAGGEYVPPSSSGDEGEGEEASEPFFPVIPIVVATPQADGSVVHIVRSGQTLWAISAIYEVELDQLLTLNGLLNNSFIFPGDEIIVRAAAQVTPTSPASPTEAAPTPRATASATAQATESVALVASDEGSNPDAPEREEAEEENAQARMIIALALFVIAMVILASFFVRSQPEAPSEESDPFGPIE